MLHFLNQNLKKKFFLIRLQGQGFQCFFISDVYTDIKGRTSEIFSRSTIFIWQVRWEAVVTIAYMTANHCLTQTQGSTQEL